MKKLGRAIAGSSHGRDRDGQNGRRGSQGGKNTDGHQGGGATAATGGPNTSTHTTGGGNNSRGGYQPQRGAGGNQGTKRGGGSDRPSDQEFTEQDMPPHMRSTYASQSRQVQVKFDVTTTKKSDASASKITKGAAVGSSIEKPNSPSDAELKRVFGAILNDPTHKGVYNVPTGKAGESDKDHRKLKIENEESRVNREQFASALEAKDAELEKLNKILVKKAIELNDMEENLKKSQDDYSQLNDSASKLRTELEDKDAKVLKLTTEVNDYEKLLKQAQHKNAEVEGEYNKLKDHSVKLQDKVKRYKQHHEKTLKEIEQLKEENKQLSQSRDGEVAKWEDVEQKLAQTKVDLAEAQATVDNKDYCVVEMENEHAKKKMTELTTELEEKKRELEYNKQALEKKDRENLQMKIDYQQQLEEKMRILATEYEEKLKTTEARAESAEKSVNWSHVKANESEKQQEQLNNIIDELKAKNKALTKENEDNKSIREKEHQRILELADEVTKLQGTNKQMEDAINNKETELTKMTSKLKEAETSKLELEKMQQSNLANKQSEELQKRNNETMEQLESTLKEKDVTINQLKLDMNKMEQELKELKEHISSAERKDKENLLQENDDPANSAKLQQLMEEKEKQMQAGYKEREDRIAELEEFINDQVTELDKMEAAMKQTVTNKEFAEKELNEALAKKQAELTALQVAYEEKEKEICQSVSPDDKEESSRVNSELAQAKEKLAQANKQLLAYEEKIQELNETLAKQESTSSKGSVDTDGLRETTKRLTREVAMLRKQNSELEEENKSLSKRCENYRSSAEILTKMMQKQPGTEMQTTFATKINELNQQVAHLQEENVKFQSLTTEAAHKPSHESDQEFHSSVEQQGHIDQPAQFQKRLKELESELESTRSTLEAERKKYEELKEQALHQQSTTQNVTIGKTSRDHSPDDIDQLLKEHKGVKQTQGQIYESYQKLKERYRQSEEEIDRLGTQYSQLQTDFEKQRAELNKAKEELEKISEFVQEQHEKLVVAERDRDNAMVNQKESEQKKIELNATNTEMRNNHSLLIKSKDDEIEKLRKDVDSKEFEIAELSADKKDLEEKLARKRSRVSTTQVDSDQGTEVLQGCSKESAHPSLKNSTLVAISSESLLREKEQTIEKLSKEVEQLQKQKIKSSDDSGVGDPCVEHAQSGGVGESPNEGNRNADDSYIKRQLLESQSRVDELTKELAVERSVTDNAKSEMDKLMGQLQQLQIEKRKLEQQMNAGYKEREDRIAELEEFINDQVTELDKMEAAMKQTVANKQAIEENIKDALKSKGIIEKEYQKLQEYHEQVKNDLFERDTELLVTKQTNDQLSLEADALKSANHNLSKEVARLIEVDKELSKAKEQIKHAENELATKEFLIQTYKEDFEQERKDRENAHRIKEEEIQKVRVEQEGLKADHHENLQLIQDNYKGQITAYTQKIHQLTKDYEKLSQEHARLRGALEKERKEGQSKVHQVTADNEKFTQEIARLRTALEKERKEAQTKVDIYKNKTEQFQKQWKRREEAEKEIKDLTDQLKAQRELNTQQHITIDALQRKWKGIENKIPASVSGTPVDKQQNQWREASHHSMTTPHAVDQQSSSHSPSMGSKYQPRHDPALAQTNADMYHYQQQQQLYQQEVWKQEQQLQQQYQRNQQPLQIKGQGRGIFHNQPVRPGGDVYAGGANYPQKHLLPIRDNLGGQPMSLGRVNVPQKDYSTVGTNATPQHDTPAIDDTYRMHDRLNNPPMSLDSFRSKNPAPVSEGINEEIRIQADLQRRQQQEDEFESGLAYDPYLICHKCNRQFREGQLPEYRHHIDNCRH